MTNQQAAAAAFTARNDEMSAFTFGEWATMTDIAARSAREQEINDRHGYRHGWIVINGEGFNMEMAFPTERFNRFPADQGLSD